MEKLQNEEELRQQLNEINDRIDKIAIREEVQAMNEDILAEFFEDKGMCS